MTEWKDIYLLFAGYFLTRILDYIFEHRKVKQTTSGIINVYFHRQIVPFLIYFGIMNFCIGTLVYQFGNKSPIDKESLFLILSAWSLLMITYNSFGDSLDNYLKEIRNRKQHNSSLQ